MHVNALRRWTAFPSNWIRFKTNVSRETPPPQQRQEKEFSKTITSNLTTPPCVSRETHWHPWDVVKQKQCFTWNKWVVVKTSCFTWNIEKHWNTRKHKTKWQNPANPTFICANTPQPPHKTSFKTRPQAQKISFTSITYVPCETQQLNKLQQPTTFHVKHQLPTTNREETTLLNNQPANRSTPQCFTWNATTRSMNSPLQLRQLMFHVKPKPETKIPLQQRNYLPPTNPSK